SAASGNAAWLGELGTSPTASTLSFAGPGSKARQLHMRQLFGLMSECENAVCPHLQRGRVMRPPDLPLFARKFSCLPFPSVPATIRRMSNLDNQISQIASYLRGINESLASIAAAVRKSAETPRVSEGPPQSRPPR